MRHVLTKNEENYNIEPFDFRQMSTKDELFEFNTKMANMADMQKMVCDDLLQTV